MGGGVRECSRGGVEEEEEEEEREVIKFSLERFATKKRCELFERHWEYGFFVVVGCEFGDLLGKCKFGPPPRTLQRHYFPAAQGYFFFFVFFPLWHFHKHLAHTVIIFNSSPSLLLFLLLSLSRSRSPPSPSPFFFALFFHFWLLNFYISLTFSIPSYLDFLFFFSFFPFF